MANVDTYPTEASLQDADSVLGIDASAATGIKTNRFLLSALRTFFGDQRVPVPETAHGFSVGDLVYRSAGGWAQADATDLASAMYTGIVAAVPDVDNFVLQMIGFVTGLSGLTDGTWYYLQDDGSLDTTPGTTWCPVLMAVGTTTGFLSPSSPAPELGQAVDFDPTGVATSSVIVRNASGGWQILKNNIGTVAPTVNDDSGDGYTIGSRWYDTTGDAEYVCLDASAGAAAWKKTTP